MWSIGKKEEEEEEEEIKKVMATQTIGITALSDVYLDEHHRHYWFRHSE
jgi:predicted transcriptional regulator